MHKRYAKAVITSIWDDGAKLRSWQDTLLAVLEAKQKLGRIPAGSFEEIKKVLETVPIDLSWWEARDREIQHDATAFVDERLRHLPQDLAPFLYEDLTSYDMEEPAFAYMLLDSSDLIEAGLTGLIDVIRRLALRYKHTIMLGRTHGQWAELQTFGKVCLTHYRSLQLLVERLRAARRPLHYSKLSGAIGNYSGLDPEVEKVALDLLGLTPFYGATQIMPRVLYVPLAEALVSIVLSIHKIALDIRLNARSGNPILREPFGRSQKGSSRMPQKQNTIKTEQLSGMARMAKGYFLMILENIETWEERAIEQSCVERIAWPDLFHVTLHATETLTAILSGLRVYPKAMQREVLESRGTYAAGAAKDFLRKHASAVGLSSEDAYRIVQVAAWNVFGAEKPSDPSTDAKDFGLDDLEVAAALRSGLSAEHLYGELPADNIKRVIEEGYLERVPQLAVTEATIAHWNSALRILLAPAVGFRKEWDSLFLPSRLLRNEKILYEKIFGKETSSAEKS